MKPAVEVPRLLGSPWNIVCDTHSQHKVDPESGGIIFGNPGQDIQAAFDVAAFQGNMAQ